MKNLSHKTLAIMSSFLLLILPMFVFGQITNPLQGGTDIPTFISMILGYIVTIGGIVATFAFIWAGFLYVKAQGSDTELSKAKEVFVNTCLGTAVLLGAQLLSSIITGTISSITKK
jgi:hypothetical protein